MQAGAKSPAAIALQRRVRLCHDANATADVPVSMLIATINTLTIMLYGGGAALLWRQLRAPDREHRRPAFRALAFAALALHALLLYHDLVRPGGVNLGLTPALSLVAWAVTALFLLATLAQPVETLGLFILPTAAAAVAAAWAWPAEHVLAVRGAPLAAAHVIVSLLAYSLLGVALVQGLVLALQERWLRGRPRRGLLDALPPLETMELLMFQMVTAGFVLLSAALVSGVFFSEQVFGRPIKFTHHIVLSLVSWAVFAVLLVGHWRYGWRGRRAMRWALAGFVLLVLAYFGTKFVLEILLGRA
jgi:ABC-type uncharacterized transport system permease subunit